MLVVPSNTVLYDSDYFAPAAVHLSLIGTIFWRYPVHQGKEMAESHPGSGSLKARYR